MGVFTYNDVTHRYYMDGKQMTGVTTILGVIAKPQLIGWASNQAIDFLETAGIPTELKGELLVTKSMRDEARKSYAVTRDGTADLGKKVHAEVEQFIKCRISGIDWMTDNPQVQHFINWADKHNVEFLASEEQVYSEKLFVAGTYDFSCLIDGRKYLGDLKTANALYPEYFYQCGGYRMLCEEMGQTDFVGSILVRIGRDGLFNEDSDVIISESYEDEKQAFLSALTLYRITQRYETKRKGSKAL